MSEKDLGSALGKIPSGLFIVTVRQGDVETGMLASWVQQCSFVPPRISVAVKPERSINCMLREGDSLVVNIASVQSKNLISHFGRGFEPGQSAFEGIQVDRPTHQSAPILKDALAYLCCRVVDRVSVGDHDLVIGDVLDGAILGEGEPRVHIRKNGFNY